MMSEEVIRKYADSMKELEEKEPILAAWRYEEGAPPRSVKQKLFSNLSQIKHSYVDKKLKMSTPKKGQLIVFPLSFTPATTKTILPILNELKNQNNNGFLVVRDKTLFLLKKGLVTEHIHLQKLFTLVSFNKKRKLIIQAKHFANEMAKRIPCSDKTRTRQWILDGLIMRESVKKWLDFGNSIVFDSDIAAFQKGFILGAKSRGATTFILQHGFLGEQQFPTTCNYFLCWGDYFKKQAINNFGMNEEQIVTVGCVRWDHLEEIRSQPRDEKIKRKLGGRSQRPLILLLSNSHSAKRYLNYYLPFFKSVQKLIEADFDVVVKLHPSEGGLMVYRKYLPDNIVDKLHIVPSEIDLYQALKHSDIAFQVFTAAVLEAMLLDIPVLYERGEGEKLIDFPDLGGGQWCNEKDIVEICNDLSFAGTARKTFLEKQEKFLENVLANRGKAAQFAVKTIMKKSGI